MLASGDGPSGDAGPPDKSMRSSRCPSASWEHFSHRDPTYSESYSSAWLSSFDFFWSSHQQRYLYHLYEAKLNQFQTEYFASMYLSLIIKMDDWEFWKNQFPPQILPVEAAGPVSALNHFLPILSSSTIKTILFYHSSSKFSFSFVKMKISFIFAKSAPIIVHHNLKRSYRSWKNTIADQVYIQQLQIIEREIFCQMPQEWQSGYHNWVAHTP